jgi:ribosomal protein L35AE/L33A
MRDLEEPYYNQIFYVPEVEFNAYDGIALGLKLSNRSILNKPFTFSVTPMYSSNTGKFVGKDVEWKSPANKIVKGKVAAAHGNKGVLRAVFERGLPGQAVTTKVEIK